MRYTYHNIYTISLVTLTALFYLFFFFNDTATTEIYTLSLHDALPIYMKAPEDAGVFAPSWGQRVAVGICIAFTRSEEHTSELQSLAYLVCRLLLEKKKKKKIGTHLTTVHEHVVVKM